MSKVTKDDPRYKVIENGAGEFIVLEKESYSTLGGLGFIYLTLATYKKKQTALDELHRLKQSLQYQEDLAKKRDQIIQEWS